MLANLPFNRKLVDLFHVFLSLWYRPFCSSMGDSEIVVAEASAAETYASAGYDATSSNPAPEAGASATAAEFTGEGAQANSTYGFTYSGEGNAYAGDPNSVLQQTQFTATDESKQTSGETNANEASGALGNAATNSTMVSGDNSSVNGGVGAGATGLENGNALENVDGSADEKQLADGYGIYLYTM